MIIVKLLGGLGNQMFQYAAGQALATRLKTDLVLDKSGFDNMHPDDTPRHYELDCFPVRSRLANVNDLSRIREAGKQGTFFERVKRQLLSNGPIFTYSEPVKADLQHFSQLRNNTCLVGWWQDEAYFKQIREALVNDFTPRKLGSVSKKYRQKIATTKTPVSLHVRRGDYVTNKNAHKHHGLVSLDYYSKAIKHMDSLLDNPTYFVFSDDIEWCKKNMKAKNIVFVEKTAAGYEDMYLMSQCKHNILANSSFSWWGAWLNQNKDKIVIAPKIWFQNSESNNAADIVLKDWIRF